MEILVVVGSLSGTGGIETCIETLAREAETVGDHVRVLALAPSALDEAWHQQIDYSEVPDGSRSLRKQMVRGLPAIIKSCKARPPDVVVVIYSSTIPLVRLALLLAGVRRPVVAWLHFSMAHKQRTNLLRYAHAHLCISSEIADGTKEVSGVTAESVHLVYNGAPFETAALIPRSRNGPLRLLHVGRLMIGRQKRTDDLLRALAGVRGDWRLDLIGAGDEAEDMPQLLTLAEELGIADRLTWHGRQVNPWGGVPAADLLVMCSAFEGFPMVLVEAMAHGVPCLSSDCSSGPADIIRPGRNGWLFPVADTQALAGQLQRLIGHRELLPSSTAVRASAKGFSSEKVFQRIRDAFEQTIQRYDRRKTT